MQCHVDGLSALWIGTKMNALLKMSTPCNQRMHKEVRRGGGEGQCSAVPRGWARRLEKRHKDDGVAQDVNTLRSKDAQKGGKEGGGAVQ